MYWVVFKKHKTQRRCLISVKLLCFNFVQQPRCFQYSDTVTYTSALLSATLHVRSFVLNFSALHFNTSETP